jgi:branched-chain amino acid transport system ATP-binding protein
MSAAPIIEAEGIVKAFGSVVAIDGVGIRVAPGEIVSLIGPNGAGKTTLFNILSGFLSADSGRVVLDGVDITKMAPNRIARLGLIRTFQTARPLTDATVLENVLAGSYLHARGGALSALFRGRRFRRDERELADRADQVLHSVGLEHHANRYPGELTAGQLRLLEIARALAAAPRVLLLDEPAAGLNRSETDRIERTLLDIRGSGTAVLLVEHDVDLVLRVSDWVTVVDFGRPLSQGTPEQIRRDPAVAAAYFGTGDAAEAKSEGANE